MLGKVAVQVDGREVFSQTPRVTTQEFAFRLLGSDAKLRFGASTVSSYGTCELEVQGVATRLLEPGEAPGPVSQPAPPEKRNSHLLGGLGGVFAFQSFMMTMRKPPPGRRVEYGLFQMALGAIGFVLMVLDWAVSRKKH
jgi:hypothetical protein